MLTRAEATAALETARADLAALDARRRAWEAERPGREKMDLTPFDREYEAAFASVRSAKGALRHAS